jgi:hypothetical protein
MVGRKEAVVVAAVRAAAIITITSINNTISFLRWKLARRC